MTTIRPSFVLPLLALLCCIATASVAQTSLWTQLDTHAVADFAFQPNGFVFGALSNIDTQTPGIIRSTDDGLSWQVVLGAKVQKLEAAMSGVLYAMGYDTLYRSTDHGDHWTVLPTPFLGGSTFATCLRSDGDGRLFLGVGSPAQVYISTDQGESWQTIRGRMGYGAAVFDIVPFGRTIFAATDMDLFQSDPLMRTWRRRMLPAARRPYAIRTLHRSENGDVYAASAGGHVWTYGRPGARTEIRRWVHHAVPVAGVDGFTLDLQGGLYWGRSGVLRSTDRGMTWSSVNPGSTTRALSTTALATNTPGDVYLSNWEGIFRCSATAIARSAPVAAGEIAGAVPARFALSQNYPNPFNPTTNLDVDLAAESSVSLVVSDALGRIVATLAENDVLAAGSVQFEFDASALPSGAYFYRLTAAPLHAGDGAPFVRTRKMLLLR